jgi:hypothetical protein
MLVSGSSMDGSGLELDVARQKRRIGIHGVRNDLRRLALPIWLSGHSHGLTVVSASQRRSPD